MHINRSASILWLFIYLFFSLNSQAQYINESMVIKKQYNFVNPLDIPLFLSGNFGEPRSTHFHTGLDIRTGARTGLNIYSIDDGYISRIGISGKGYGKVIYITHPQHQMTSVYAHLDNFSERVNEYIKAIQYSTKQSEMDTILPPNYIKVKKGEVVALTGNSGGSGGPHLHFEIRDSKNDEAINPELVGFKIRDEIAPSVFAIKLYDLGPRKIEANGRIMPLKRVADYFTPSTTTINVNANDIGISVEAIDKSFNSIGRNGIYQMKMYKNKNLVFESKMNRIHFEDWRYSYSYTDCGERMKHDAIFHKCFVDECNEAKIYEMHENRGIIHIQDNIATLIEIELFDKAHNVTKIKFVVEGNKDAPFFTYKPLAATENWLDCKMENLFEADDIKVIVPTFCLADNIKFIYSVKPGPKYFSDIHQVHCNADPLLDSIYIEIKAKNLPSSLRSKAMIGYLDCGLVKFAGGDYKNGYVSTWFAKFASYFITVDTSPPRVLSSNIINHKKLAGNMISFKITDYLSGIKNFQMMLDGVWTPMYFDAKTHHLFCKLEKSLAPGMHDLYLELTDFKKNTSKHRYTFLK